jgi:hypothetical protein
MLLGHLGQRHRDQVKRFTNRMHASTDISRVAAEAYEVIEQNGEDPA